MPLVLTEHDVKSLLPVADLIDAMEAALVRFSAGQVVQPLRTVMAVGPEKSYFGVMPAYQPDDSALGVKIVTVVNSNHERGLPSHLATVLLFDETTGRLLAIIDGRYITEARTAAVSAVSVRHLAAPAADRLAIFGSGVQARSHLRAIPVVRSLSTVQVWDPDRARLERFVQEMRPELAPVSVTAAASGADACRGASIVLTATSSKTPVVERAWVENGAHVICIGAPLATERELDPALVADARLIVDSRAGALKESGDVVLSIAEGIITPEHIAGELGEVAAGRVAGRQRPDQITLFKSLGMAVEDVVAASMAFERASRAGRGTPLDL
jgi:ornithine cyclodeaminase